LKVGDLIELRLCSHGNSELAFVIKMRQKVDSWEVTRSSNYACDVLTVENNKRMSVFADEVIKVISNE